MLKSPLYSFIVTSDFRTEILTIANHLDLNMDKNYVIEFFAPHDDKIMNEKLIQSQKSIEEEFIRTDTPSLSVERL